jgi:uncharacterized protein YlxW (UPF0749 family)
VLPDRQPSPAAGDGAGAADARRTSLIRWLRGRRRRSLGVGLVFAVAGFLFTTSAQTARGTQLRSERADLAGLIQAETERLRARQDRVAQLDAEVDRDTTVVAAGSDAIRTLQRRSATLADAAGTRPVHGPALRVTLDDAPRDEPVPADAMPDDLVVHQQDVQGVVNALWAGGAEAMMLQDQRVIATSAVRCVGNTLILQGRVYSPPYVITAIGDVAEMQRALDDSPEVAYYLQYVAALNLGYQVQRLDDVRLPGYAGSLTLDHARAPGRAGATATPPGTTPATTPGGTATESATDAAQETP